MEQQKTPRPATALAATALALAALAGCAEGSAGQGGGGEDSASGGADGSGGAGGAGGSAASGATGECAEDCSKLSGVPACFVAKCNASTALCEVVPAEKGAACDDGDFCTADDFCDAGTCRGGKPNTCGLEASECIAVTCDAILEACRLVAVDDGTPCTNKDLCTVNATCKSGFCKGAPKDCFFAPTPNDCHVAECNPDTGACEPKPGNDGQKCVTGDPCMTDKKCSEGECQGGKVRTCTFLDKGCQKGVCDPVFGGCVAEPIPAGGACAIKTKECNQGVCDAAGTCSFDASVPQACDSAANACNAGLCGASGLCESVPTNEGGPCPGATDACNVGACDAGGVCVGSPANEGGACDDGDACTSGDKCGAGSCAGAPASGYVVYLRETFASNAAGWALGEGWEIGPAKASPGQAKKEEDPAHDHTISPDNGVAGVVIGGYVEAELTAPAFLVSPAFNAEVPGRIWLRFWRHLDSDNLPYMNNFVEVYNGTTWSRLWESGKTEIHDAEWTLVEHDLTPFKNPAMRVRIGYEVTQTDFLATSSGWSVDDVVVSSKNSACQDE